MFEVASQGSTGVICLFFPIFDDSGVIVAITLKGSSGVIVVKEFVVLKPN